MTYVVTEQCIRCKYTDCVEVCPVDCFREGEQMLVIDPDVCIDCAVCEPACPVEAIKPDANDEGGRWTALNAALAKTWPSIVQRREPHPAAEVSAGQTGKYELHLAPTLHPTLKHN